jgi:hypothetical protein
MSRRRQLMAGLCCEDTGRGAATVAASSRVRTRCLPHATMLHSCGQVRNFVAGRVAIGGAAKSRWGSGCQAHHMLTGSAVDPSDLPLRLPRARARGHCSMRVKQHTYLASTWCAARFYSRAAAAVGRHDRSGFMDLTVHFLQKEMLRFPKAHRTLRGSHMSPFQTRMRCNVPINQPQSATTLAMPLVTRRCRWSRRDREGERMHRLVCEVLQVVGERCRYVTVDHAVGDVDETPLAREED